MALGLMLFLFLVTLVLVSVGPLKDWTLKPEPLDEDNLRWPAFGYGSAAVSLNCLFGAYSATLLLMGYTCFVGVVMGVATGLFLLGYWLRQSDLPRGFQSMLYGLNIFESPVLDKLFWFLLSFCQLGLALSELILLRHVFAVGLGFSEPHAIAAALSIACVAYYYCLIGGYHALFRTDILQYVMIISMACVLLVLVWRLPSSSVDTTTLLEGVKNSLYRPVVPDFIWRHPYLRAGLEVLAGFALGIMPVIAAPDAWKRIFTVRRERGVDQGSSLRQGVPRRRRLRLLLSTWLAPSKLLLATAIPIALITPLLLEFSEGGMQDDWLFPLRTLLALSPEFLDAFIVLGMTAAFMSTFDSAHLSATHVILGQRIFPSLKAESELQRFRLIFGGSFLVIILAFFASTELLAHPYVLGATLVGPFALAGGLLMGTSLGKRQIKGEGIIYVTVGVVGIWVVLVLDYLTMPATEENPYLAFTLIASSCCLFFLVSVFSRAFSR